MDPYYFNDLTADELQAIASKRQELAKLQAKAAELVMDRIFQALQA